MLDYCLDISAASSYKILTLDSSAKLFPFYATEYGFFEAGKGYYTRRDGKNAALLLYTLDGRGEIEWKGRKAALNPGSAVVIYCDTYHSYRTLSQVPWRFKWVHFDGNGLEGYRVALLDHLSPVNLKSIDSMSSFFDMLERSDAENGLTAWAGIGHAISGMLLTLLSSLTTASDSQPGLRDEVRTLAEYIRENCAKPLTIDDFALVSHVSKYHLIHLFHKQIGMPPYRYMHYCRINYAQRLLCTTDDTVASIGELVGYTEEVSFIRMFRTFTGTTPAKYRRESIKLP